MSLVLLHSFIRKLKDYLLTPVSFFYLSHFIFLRVKQILFVLPVPGVSATPYEDNLRYFNVAIAGPVDSPYESTYLKSFHIGYWSLHMLRWHVSP